MKTIKKLCKIVLLAAVCLSLAGCDLLSPEAELLSPPKPSGELFKIQKAIVAAATGKITLKYPTEGEYRSAIIRYDLTGDNSDEAIAFYSTTSDNILTMHIVVATGEDGKWKAGKDVQIPASGVEKVMFEDLDGDGKSEIIVGWNIYGGVDREVTVYSLSEGTLTQRIQEKYTGFLTCDLDTDQKKELFVLYLDTASKSSTATLYTLTADGISENGKCQADGNVSEYTSLCVSKLLGGRAAIFADAKKGDRALTEIFCINGGMLVDPVYNPESKLTEKTIRSSAVVSSDINGDDALDIPMQEVLTGYEFASESDKIYMTKWCSFDGEKLVVVKNTVMNYTDAYYFEIPKELLGRITIDRKVETRTRVFYLYDAATGSKISELFRISVISEKQWDSKDYDRADFTEVVREGGLVYAVKRSNYEGDSSLSLETIKNLITLIK